MWVVTGASGFVGAACLHELRRCGIEAEGLYRSGSIGRVVPTFTRERLRPALAGARGIVHCAAVVHQPHGAPEAHRFNVDGTRALVEAAQDVGAGAFVFLSSIKVHGESAPQIDEKTPVAPEGPYATAKAEAEDIVRNARDMRTVIVRLCPVFGRGDRGNVRTMIRAVQRRLFFVPGSGETKKSIVHISTVADVVARLATSSARETFVLADRETPTLRVLADSIARALQRRRPPSMPLPALRLAARFAERLAQAAGRNTPLNLAQLTKATSPTVCDPSSLERAIDYRCHVDLDAMIDDEVEWLRGIGEL